MSGDPVLELESVSKVYTPDGRDSVVAVGDVSFSVSEGEFVTIVGPSGCGKSTILRLVAGLTGPSEGLVRVRGGTARRGRQDVAMVFQKPVLLDWMSILGNVLLPARLRKQDTDEIEGRAISLLNMLGIGDFRDHLPRELSGGMQQRAGMARALLMDPEIMLLDEPFGSLDALTREQLNAELQEIFISSGSKSILMVTHDVREAVYQSDRVIVLSSRPSTVVDVVPIDIPRPRTPEIELTEIGVAAMHRIREKLGVVKGDSGEEPPVASSA